MKAINLPLIGDSLFTAACAFLLFFTVVRYYTKNVALALTLAIFAFVVFGCLAFLYIRKKQHKKFLSLAADKEKNKLALYLRTVDYNNVLNLFASALGGEIVGGNVVASDTVYYFNFSLDPLSLDDIAGVIADNQSVNKVLVCNKISGDSQSFADNYCIKIMQAEDVYLLLKKSELLPESYTFTTKSRQNIFKRIAARLNRKRCIPLFWCGFSLLFFSFFTFFPLYYIIVGSLLLMLSAVCLIFGKRA